MKKQLEIFTYIIAAYIQICCRLTGKSWIFGIYYWVFESLQHKVKLFVFIWHIQQINNTGGYSSIGRATVCGTVNSLFDPGYPPFFSLVSKHQSI